MHIHVKKNTTIHWLICSICNRQQSEEIKTIELLTALVSVIANEVAYKANSNNIESQFFNTYRGIVSSLDDYPNTVYSGKATGSDRPRAFINFAAIGDRIQKWCKLIDLEYILVDIYFDATVIDTMAIFGINLKVENVS